MVSGFIGAAKKVKIEKFQRLIKSSCEIPHTSAKFGVQRQKRYSCGINNLLRVLLNEFGRLIKALIQFTSLSGSIDIWI